MSTELALATSGGLNIKGLDTYNMPLSGDVMLPVRQIHKQIADVGVQERWIVRAMLEVLVVERIEEQK